MFTGPDGRISHSKALTTIVVLAGVAFAFLCKITVAGVALWSLLLAGSFGIQGLKLWLQSRGGGTVDALAIAAKAEIEARRLAGREFDAEPTP